MSKLGEFSARRPCAEAGKKKKEERTEKEEIWFDCLFFLSIPISFSKHRCAYLYVCVFLYVHVSIYLLPFVKETLLPFDCSQNRCDSRHPINMANVDKRLMLYQMHSRECDNAILYIHSSKNRTGDALGIEINDLSADHKRGKIIVSPVVICEPRGAPERDWTDGCHVQNDARIVWMRCWRWYGCFWRWNRTPGFDFEIPV